MKSALRRWAAVWVVASIAIVAVVFPRLRPREVSTVTLETRDIRRTLVVVGRVRPASRAELGAAVSGVVREVRVRDGQRVTEGEVLVRLEDRLERAAVSEAEARLVEVEASTRSEIERAALEAEQARRDLERVRSVRAVGGLTDQLVDQAEQRAADAESRLAAARASVGGAEPGAAVTAARSALEAARARLALMAVTAPAQGVVLERLAEPGDAVQPGRGLIGFAADGPVEVEAYPGEENLARLDVGAAARVSADAYPDDVFEGTVLWVAPSVDPSQGTVEVRLAVPEAPEYLLPGMTLSVSLEVGRAEGASVLVADAVRGLGSGDPWVAVVQAGRVERRDVVVGLRGEAHVQVIDGLAPGEPVVPASEGVEPGDRVRTRDGR